MSSPAIQVENLGKRYRIGVQEEETGTLVGQLSSWVTSPISNFRNLRRLSRFDENGDAPDVIWALRDVSFEVEEGAVLGVIGRNGAGKSTLLKVLSRITTPTTGRVKLYGRVASLLEVGTGFHQELTGRENTYLNGTILGMSKAEIDRKFDEIVDFSGIEQFIDTPVKRYSSGMKVRLAFAVAAHLEPEILLVDEVLAVGDVGFQKKSLGKMREVATAGRTVLLVSHNMGAILSLCDSAILLHHGRLQAIGDTTELVRTYQDSFIDNSVSLQRGGKVWFGDIVIGEQGNYTMQATDALHLELNFGFRNPPGSFGVFCFIENDRGEQVLNTRLTSRDLAEGNHIYKATIDFPPVWLNPGLYTVYFKIIVRDSLEDNGRYFSERIPFTISGRVNKGKTVLTPPVDWHIMQFPNGKHPVSVNKKQVHE